MGLMAYLTQDQHVVNVLWERMERLQRHVPND
jgi:hypothetical protein